MLPIPPSLPPPRDPHAGALDPCATFYRSRPIGPLQVGELEGMLGVPYRACPRNELAIGGGFLLSADTADFYGHLVAYGQLRVSGLIDPNVEGFIVWEPIRFDRVISSVTADYVGLGLLSWGATARVWSEGGGVIAVTGRFVAPATTGLYRGSQPLALDLGVSAAWQADRNFRLHAWLTLLGSINVSANAPVVPYGGVRAGGGVDWSPFEWLAFVLELQTGFGYRDAVDLIAANAGVRLAFGNEVGLELAVQLPFAGVRALEDGALPLAATLNVSWRYQ